MSRRQARELALQSLFQLDFNPADGEDSQQAARENVIAAAVAEVEEGRIGSRDAAFLKELVDGTMDNLSAIDELISNASEKWKISRMAGVDRNITRMAVYELRFREEKVTPNIIINEAIELAKKFGDDNTSRFINGILGAIAKDNK